MQLKRIAQFCLAPLTPNPLLKRTANGRPPGPVWPGLAVRGTFSPAWAWRPAFVARIAPTLGLANRTFRALQP